MHYSEGEDGDESDEREGEISDWTSPRIPGIVTVAGVLWIAVGSLAIINMMITFGRGAPNGNPAGGCCAGLIGLAFVVCGHQTVTGKAKDTLGNAIGSLLLGLIQVTIAAAIALGAVAVPAGPNAAGRAPQPGVMLVVAVMVGLMGSTLILAGILALAGRSAYAEWRRENAPSSRSRRRGNDEWERE